ncbi:MAG: hypothetical protein IT577_20600 [Verrucomicrobiae bacterium]|nr:hypothetical protein [Verrucomicrobiae bacterium]
MGMDDFRSDPLWEVMGRARRPEPSPWLAGRIVAAARAEVSGPGRWGIGALWRWLALPAGVAAILLAVMVVSRPMHSDSAADSAQLYAALEAFADNAFEVDYLWSSDSF